MYMFNILKFTKKDLKVISLQVPGHEATDPIILLVSSVFRLAEVEKRAAEAGFSSLLRKDWNSIEIYRLILATNILSLRL